MKHREPLWRTSPLPPSSPAPLLPCTLAPPHLCTENVEHYPDLSGFPDHVHIGEEGDVGPGERLGIVELLDVLTAEMGGEDNGETANSESESAELK